MNFILHAISILKQSKTKKEILNTNKEKCLSPVSQT